MNVKNAKKAEPRIDTGYVSRFRMQKYGYNNLYPQNLRRITMASGTAELCLNRYQKFIEGYGFDSEVLSDCIVNSFGMTADDILHLVCQDLARYHGFALHVNYNVLCQITEISFIPFENCRLEEDDDAGNVAHILIHPDWEQRKTRNGKRIFINEKNIKRLNVFNPDPEVVRGQIESCGGIEGYDGQVIWCSMDGKFVYPTPIYDASVTDMSTDEGLGNVKYRNVRQNFLVACMLIMKKGVPKVDDNGKEVDEGEMISPEDLVQFQGDEKTGKILAVTLENDEDEPKVVAFPTKNFDKDYNVTEASVIERIYAQFHQELFYAIRIGKLGFSGDVMSDAYSYYAGEVTTEQRFIERVFDMIFEHWKEASLSNIGFKLQPLKYISSNGAIVNSVENE